MTTSISAKNLSAITLCGLLAGCPANLTKVTLPGPDGYDYPGWADQLIIDGEGNELVYGFLWDPEAHNVTGFSVFVAKLNSAGDAVWVYSPENAGNSTTDADFANNDISTDSEGNVLYHFYRLDDIYLGLLDSDGNLLWENPVSGHWSHNVSTAIVDEDTYLLKRSFYTFYELAAFNRAGELLWEYREDYAETNYEDAEMVSLGETLVIKQPRSLDLFDKNGNLLDSLSVDALGGGNFLDIANNADFISVIRSSESNDQITVLILDNDLNILQQTEMDIADQGLYPRTATVAVNESGKACFLYGSLAVGALDTQGGLWVSHDEPIYYGQDVVGIEAVADGCSVHSTEASNPTADTFREMGYVSATYQFDWQGDLTNTYEIRDFQAASALTTNGTLYLVGGGKLPNYFQSPFPGVAYYKRKL